MKKFLLLIFSVIFCFSVYGQEKMYVHKSDSITLGILVSETDSIYFSSDGSIVYFDLGDTVAQFQRTSIDSILPGYNDTSVYITYYGATASVINPLAFEGVNVSVSGAHVTVTQTGDIRDINYKLSGTATDGMFKIYSEKRFNLLLNGVTITNSDGPAINIQSDNKAYIELIDGTTSTLTDGSAYAAPATNSEGESEDQDAAFFSEGKLEFTGNGYLVINGLGSSKHGLCSDDIIEIDNGNITVASALKDGIHGNDGFKVHGGTVSSTAYSDAIDAGDGYILIDGGSITTVNTTSDTKGLKCDSSFIMSGGTLNMTVSGYKSKGIKSAQDMTLSGGTINISTSGSAVLVASGSGYEPSYCTGINSDSTIIISGSSITITSTGIAGKGISANGNISVTGGSVSITTSGSGATYTNSSGEADAYTSTGITTDENLYITGGTVTTISSGTGGKGISSDGNLTIGSTGTTPTVKVTTKGSRIIVSGTGASAQYAEPKGVSTDGILTINSGYVYVSTTNAGANGLDSDSTLIIAGGTVTDTVAGDEAKAIKATRDITLSGGTINLVNKGGVVLASSGSGYDPSYCVGIKTDGALTISGAALTITSSGTAGKGVSTDGNISINSGTVTITTSGAGATYTNSSATKDSYCASAISCGYNVNIIGGQVTLKSSGTGGKGLSVDSCITIGSSGSSPTLTVTTTGKGFFVKTVTSSSQTYNDSCLAKTIRSTGGITINNGAITISSANDGIHSESYVKINGGTVTISKASEGIESENIYLNGGSTAVTASNDALNATMGTVSGGTESNDGSCVYITGGTHALNSTAGDAIDSNGNISMSGGIAVANGPTSGADEDIDFNGTCSFTGGILVGAGVNLGNSVTSNYYNIVVSSSSLFSGNYIHIQNSAGTDILTFYPVYGFKYLKFFTTTLNTGTYTVMTGGSYTGTNTNGYYYSGTYSSTSTTTTKGTFTISSGSSSKTTTYTLK